MTERISWRVGVHEYGALGSIAQVPILHFEQLRGRDKPLQDVVTACDDCIEKLTRLREEAAAALEMGL